MRDKIYKQHNKNRLLSVDGKFEIFGLNDAFLNKNRQKLEIG